MKKYKQRKITFRQSGTCEKILIKTLFLLIPGILSPLFAESENIPPYEKGGFYYYDLAGLHVIPACPAGSLVTGETCKGEPGDFYPEEAVAFCKSSTPWEGSSELPAISDLHAILTRKKGEVSFPDGSYWVSEGKEILTVLIKSGKIEKRTRPEKARVLCKTPWSGDADWIESSAKQRLDAFDAYEGWLLAGLKEFNDVLLTAYRNGGVRSASFVKSMRPYIEPGPDRDRTALNFYRNYSGVREKMLLGESYTERWEVEKVILDPLAGAALVRWERSILDARGNFVPEGTYSEIWKLLARRWVFSSIQP